MGTTKTIKITFTAEGGITQSQVEDILKQHLSCNIVSADGPDQELGAADVRVEDVTDAEDKLSSLERQLGEKAKALGELEYTNSKSLASIQAFHKQQKNLFDEFVLLRTKYDEVKHSLVVILWKHCAMSHPDLREIPRQQVSIEDGGDFVETVDQIGDYKVGDMLGEGQFASVRLCWKQTPSKDGGGLDRDLALKIMNKDRIISFTMLKRVSNELYSLRILSSPYVVRLVDVLHGDNKLYIITEKGGESDLFEFFDEHPEGVPEAWALSILYYVVKALLFVHSKGICHRDLKPENILVAFNTELGICTDLKLCDFGLSTTFTSSTMLTDFCGSPGFFAPEMIIKSKAPSAAALDPSGLKSAGYFGDKADIWSVGCILLELMLGHELFCELWMSAYDYENIQNKSKFQDSISCSVRALEDELDRLNEEQAGTDPPVFSAGLVQFILGILNLDDVQRPGAYDVSQSNWCEHLFLQEREEKEARDREIAEKLASVSLARGANRHATNINTDATKKVGKRPSRHRSMSGQTPDDEHLAVVATKNRGTVSFGGAIGGVDECDSVMPLQSDLRGSQDDENALDYSTIRYTHSKDSFQPHRERERHETVLAEDLEHTLDHLDGMRAVKDDAIAGAAAAKARALEQLDPQATPQISEKERRMYAEHAQHHQEQRSIKLPPTVAREDSTGEDLLCISRSEVSSPNGSPPSVKATAAKSEEAYSTPQHHSHSTAASRALASQTAPASSAGGHLGCVSVDAGDDKLSGLALVVPAIEQHRHPHAPLKGGMSSLALQDEETEGMGTKVGLDIGSVSPTVLNLPPVISSTPNVNRAKKILNKGDALALQAETGEWMSPMGSPGGNSRLMSKANSGVDGDVVDERKSYEALSRHTNTAAGSVTVNIGDNNVISQEMIDAIASQKPLDEALLVSPIYHTANAVGEKLGSSSKK